MKARSHFITISLERWPWQEWGQTDFLGKVLGRFGGGFRWCLGLEVGTSSVIVNLLLGLVRITWGAKREEKRK